MHQAGNLTNPSMLHVLVNNYLLFCCCCCSGPLSLSDLEAIEVGLGGAATTTNRPARSNPVNMPLRSNPQSINDTSLYIGSLCTFSAQYSAARLLAKPAVLSNE